MPWAHHLLAHFNRIDSAMGDIKLRCNLVGIFIRAYHVHAASPVHFTNLYLTIVRLVWAFCKRIHYDELPHVLNMCTYHVYAARSVHFKEPALAK
jgi:hypothetical protein